MPITTQQLLALPNLGPGSSGADVRILQQWLVENGYLTQAQMNTGPGIYGPKTTAAVSAWQAKSGFNTQGNPGYFGPLSKTYLQTTTSASTSPQFTPVGGIGTTYTDQTGTTWRFNESRQWQQISSGARPTTPKLTPPPVVPVVPPAVPPAAPPAAPPGAPPAPPVDVTKPVPDTVAFKNTDAYKALPQSIKDFIDIAYNLIEVGGEAEAKMFANAIAQAKAIADPYYKTQLSLAGAEVLGAIAEKNNDFETRKEVIERARDELMQDVSNNKEFLTLEQQADISRNIRQYDEDLLTIADEAAEKGLTFATGARSRALAESRRGEQFQDVIQSGQRRFNFQIKELELKAARGDTSAQKELEALTGQKGFALQQIGRAAEEVLGSANVPAIPGFTPTGSALGKIEEEKRRTTISDVGGFLQLQKGFI